MSDSAAVSLTSPSTTFIAKQDSLMSLTDTADTPGFEMQVSNSLDLNTKKVVHINWRTLKVDSTVICEKCKTLLYDVTNLCSEMLTGF